VCNFRVSCLVDTKPCRHAYGVAANRLHSLQFVLLCSTSVLFSTPGVRGGEYKGLIVGLFTVTAGISRPFSGKLTDSVGRVPVMAIGSLVCVACGCSLTLHLRNDGVQPWAFTASVSAQARRSSAQTLCALDRCLITQRVDRSNSSQIRSFAENSSGREVFPRMHG
jgi:hypothetical protein